MPEQLAGNAGDEPDRDKHRQQHKGDGDDRSGDLRHGLLRSVFRWQVRFFLHHPLDVLHHHDRVIHDNADRQHHCQQGDRVGRIAECQQDSEGGDQADRHRDGRDQRCPPIAHEQIDHEHDQHERFAQRRQHGADRVGNEGGTVVEHLRFQPGRKALAQLPQHFAHFGRGRHGVRVGGQIDADGNGGIAVQPAFGVHARRTQFDPGQIAHPQHRAIGIGAHNDRAELLRCGQATLGLHVQLELRAVRRGPGADAPHRRLHVLLLDGLDNVGRHQTNGVQPVDVEPNPHRIIELAEQQRLAHSGGARQPVQHIQRDVVADEQRC